VLLVSGGPGEYLANAGQHAAAADASSDAVKICRDLAETDGRYWEWLAQALDFHGLHLDDLGDRQAALEAAREAAALVDARR
jgi:hypothetical protein